MAAAILAAEALTENLVPDPNAENHPPAPNSSWEPSRGRPPTKGARNSPSGKDFEGPQIHADPAADDKTDSIAAPVRPLRAGVESPGLFAGSPPVTPPHPSHTGAPPDGAPFRFFDSPVVGYGASAAFVLLREAPQAVRDIWNASFDSKRLRRR